MACAFLPAGRHGPAHDVGVGSSTSQGLTSYTLALYKISGAAWEPMETGLPAMDERSAVYLSGEKVVYAAPEGACTAYVWNSETGSFAQADEAGVG